MARYVDGLKVPTTIFEAAAFHYDVKVSCRCGHSAVFAPHGLWWKFYRKGWNDNFIDARERFYCRTCWMAAKGKARPIRIESVKQLIVIELPLPDERVWKREQRRFRG